MGVGLSWWKFPTDLDARPERNGGRQEGAGWVLDVDLMRNGAATGRRRGQAEREGRREGYTFAFDH